MIQHLTQRQSAVLGYIVDFFNEKHYPAIFSDIVRQLHITHETARYNVARLQKLGYVDWITEGRRTRAIFPLWKE